MSSMTSTVRPGACPRPLTAWIYGYSLRLSRWQFSGEDRYEDRLSATAEIERRPVVRPRTISVRSRAAPEPFAVGDQKGCPTVIGVRSERQSAGVADAQAAVNVDGRDE